MSGGFLHRASSGVLWVAEADPGEEVVRMARMAAEVTRFRSLEQVLTPLELEILTRRFGLGRDPELAEAVAKDLHLTVAQLRVAERHARAALYAAFGILGDPVDAGEPTRHRHV